MIDFLRKMRKAKYQTLNNLEIIEENILHNINFLYSLQKQAEMFPVLKSNAYGHGLKELCQILNKSQVKMVAVDSYPEAQIVYKYFKGKVLFLNEMPLKVYRYTKKKRSEFVVYNLETLKYLSRYRKKAKIHLFLNTGMNREGISDLKIFLEKGLKYLNKVDITGFCSHLAEANSLDSSMNIEQEKRFMQGLDLLREYKIFPKWLHLGASAAVFTLDNKNLSAFRPGLALYGYSPFPEDHNFSALAQKELKPALRIYSQVISVQKIRTGDRVSYADTFRAKNDFDLAVIPFGYFEGLNRRLSNKAKFFLESQKKNQESLWLPLRGLVCMNMTCLDAGLGKTDHLLGAKIQLISDLKDRENSLENLAKLSEMSPYEFLVKINHSIHRKIV